MNESDLDSDSHEIICDTDSDVDVISNSYFKINSIDALDKKNIKLKSELIKLKNINELINENLSISKKTILEMNQMISDLTNKVNELEYKNKEIKSKLIIADEKNKILTQNIKKLDTDLEELICDKKSVDIQVNDCNKSIIIYDFENNWFLSKAVYFFFVVSCSGIIYNYNQINKLN